MGYSCTKKALDRLQLIMNESGHESSNCWKDDSGQEYFYERGREQEDGAFTGTIWKFVDKNAVTKVGNIRIEPDGRVNRFPRLSSRMKGMVKAPLPDHVPFRAARV